MEINQEQRQKLECMQIKGIRRMIWQYINKEDIESRLLSIRGQKSIDNMKNFVNSQSRATLIKLIENSPEIIPSVIDEAYEKYRYGLKPGFTLFWAKRNDGRTVTKEDLEESLKQYLSEVDFEDDSKYKGLECTAITQFDDIYEISLSFLQRFNYINSDGEFTFIYMMKECFVWVGVNYNFIAINSMPDILMNMLKQFFSNLYHADITNIKITNTLLKTVFSTVCTKRITRHNANPPENQLEKVTFADRELSKKIDFIPSGYENYDVTNTQYIEDIDDSTTGTLGVNCNKGKLYLSKELTSTQFRDWSLRRIKEIIGFYESKTDVTLETIIGWNMFTSSEWGKLNQSTIATLNTIAYALIACKTSGTDNCPITIRPHKVYAELGRFFYEKISFSCDSCEEKAVPACLKCGSSVLSITKKSPFYVTCLDCGDRQAEEYSFCCENGHISSFDSIDSVLELISTDEFSQKMFSTIRKYYSDVSFVQGDYFTISMSGLAIFNSPTYAKLRPSDIEEFEPISKRVLSYSFNELSKEVYKLKEKCAHSTIENCQLCKHNRCNSVSDIGCLLKLFDGFEGFTMQPHQGHEFGDVSMVVTLDDCSQTFLGVAKSGKKKITKSSDVGREIIEQVLSAFCDTRTEIIGVIYPGMIDDQLKHLLYHEAKVHNKRLVIMDNEFMIKLFDYYIEKHGIMISN